MPLTVLQTLPAIRPTTNPYLVMLVDSLRATHVRVRFFSYRTAILGRYDLAHAHWPENLIRGRNQWRTAVRQLLMLVWLARLALTQTPIVRTMHNIGQHEEGSRRERWLLRQFDRRTAVGIRLNAFTAAPPGQVATTILHGHYRTWFALHPRCQPVPGRLAFVGMIRGYKGVDNLIEAFRGTAANLSLTIAGNPHNAALAAQIRDLAAGDSRIRLELAYVPDETLVARISEAELVVLPYRHMHNSGGALAALSLDRPVLVPANEVTRALAEEVGPGWVYTFDGDLSTAEMNRAVAAASRDHRSERPDLSAREWSRTGEQHVEAYRLALRRGRH